MVAGLQVRGGDRLSGLSNGGLRIDRERPLGVLHFLRALGLFPARNHKTVGRSRLDDPLGVLRLLRLGRLLLRVDRLLRRRGRRGRCWGWSRSGGGCLSYGQPGSPDPEHHCDK